MKISVALRATELARLDLCEVPRRARVAANGDSQRKRAARGCDLLVAAALMLSGTVSGLWGVAPSSVARAATVRASVDSSGNEADGNSSQPHLSADGSKVAFYSTASNLSGGSNFRRNVYVRDLATGVTTLVNVNSDGTADNSSVGNISISADGNKVAFDSNGSNLVPDDTNGNYIYDVFVRDLTTGVTTLVSRDSNGNQGNSDSGNSVLSADGSKVVFFSSATNLVPGDTNGGPNVFVRDLVTGVTTRVNVDSNGVAGSGNFFFFSISADGNKVSFLSDASTLVPGDTNGNYDVFVHDLTTGATTRVNVDSNGNQANDSSRVSSLSADGSKVAFDSDATNLVPGDTNEARDAFVHDLATGVTTRVSVDSNGNQGNNFSGNPNISPDGSRVAFDSGASNLVNGSSINAFDVYVRDLATGVTTRVSVDSNGNQGNSTSGNGSLSADGSKVAFQSDADNLVPGDTNQATDIFVSDVVLASNTAPSISDIANQSTPEDTPLSVNFSLSDAQTAPEALTVTASSDNPTLVPNANLVLGGSGANRTLTLTPLANTSGSATITVTVSDGTLSATDTFVLTVTPVNDAPTISAIATQTTNEDTPTGAIAFTLGDAETAAGALTVTASSSNLLLVPNANLVLGGSGTNRTLVVTPAPDQNGSTTITVTVSDGAANTSTSFVLQVLAVNDAPIAQNSNVGGSKNTPLTITLIASDVDNSSLNYSLVTPPTNGSLSGSAPNLIYTPPIGFIGADSFTFKVNDGALESNVATVSITIGGQNDAPVATDDSAQTNEDTPLDIAALANDSDADNNALSVSRVAVGADTHGSVVINANGTLTYTPEANFNGTATFLYTVSDGALESNATVTVQVLAVNDAPVAIDQSVNADNATRLRIVLGATDVDNEPLRFAILSGPRNGTLAGTAPNLIYTAKPGFRGSDGFTFGVSDGTATSRATVQIIVTGAPAVSANNDDYTLILGAEGQTQQSGVKLLANGTFQIDAPGVLRNDRFVAGSTLTLRATTSPENGRFQLRNDGSLLYLPNPRTTGLDEFTYALSDGRTTDTARVRFNVIDRRTPEVIFVTPRDRETLSQITKIAGQVRDINSGVKSVTLLWQRFDGKFWNGRSWISTATELPTVLQGSTWTYSGPLPKPGDNAATDLLPGRYDLRATATNNSGNFARVINRILVEVDASELSSVRLSSANASAAQNAIVLNFTGALDAAAGTIQHYTLTVNGAATQIGTATYANNVVTLSGLDLSAGDKITLQISGLLDASGKALQSGAINLIAR